MLITFVNININKNRITMKIINSSLFLLLSWILVFTASSFSTPNNNPTKQTDLVITTFVYRYVDNLETGERHLVISDLLEEKESIFKDDKYEILAKFEKMLISIFPTYTCITNLDDYIGGYGTNNPNVVLKREKIIEQAKQKNYPITHFSVVEVVSRY